MPPRTPALLRTAFAVLRALLGLVVLLALLAGIPVALVAVGHPPSELTNRGLDVLTQQDDGTLFLTVLTLLGWAAWAALALSTLIEAIALVRRRAAPRVRGLRGMQSFVGMLLGGLVLIVPTTASAAPATHSQPVTISAPQNVSPEEGPAATAVKDSDGRAPGPVHTVLSSTETPWSLAEQYLGNGQRWRDIAALNPDVPGAASGGYLPEGAAVQLPADARSTPASPAAANTPGTARPVPASTTKSHTATEKNAPATARKDHTCERSRTELPDHLIVKSGDSLWSLAGTYGDPGDWPELFEANKGQEQPGGGHFTDPDVIFPGQVLTVPGAAHPRDDGSSTADSREPSPTTSKPHAGSSASPTPEHEETRVPSTAPDDSRERATEGAQEAPSHKPAATGHAVAGADEDSTARTAAVLGLTASGAVAAALVGALATRRLLQRRRLRRGRKIAMPAEPLASAEERLRSVDAGHEINRLDLMLRTLAHHARTDASPLPQVSAVQLGVQGARLHLAEAAPALAPFGPTDSDTIWWCPLDSDAISPADALRDTQPPYPALAPLGTDEDGGIVLVDLEWHGALHFTGSRGLRALRTLGLCLALSPLTEQIELAVAGDETAPGLSLLDPARVRAINGLAEATVALRAHRHDQEAVLSGEGLNAARLTDDAVWPLIVLADLDSCSSPEDADSARDLTSQEPVAAVAVVTAGGTADVDEDTAWVIDTDAPAVTVPGTSLVCAVSASSDEEYAETFDLVLVTEQADVPDTGAPAHDLVAADDTSIADAVSAPAPAPGGGPDTAPGEAAPRTGALAGLADLSEDPDPAEDLEHEREGAEDSSAAGDGPSLKKCAPAEAAPARAVVHARISAPEHDIVVKAASGPVIRVLGKVDLEGTAGNITSNRRTRALEIAAWLAFHPGSDRHALDKCIEPAGVVSTNVRNSRINDLRRWLGSGPDGTAYLPHVTAQPDKRYRLRGVTLDWELFQELAAAGEADPGPEGDEKMAAALRMVTGQPFADIPPRRYQWAEPIIQDMIRAIVHTAEGYAERRLVHDDPRGALWAASHGLSVAREAEVLWCLKFRALALLGHHEELENSIRALEQYLADLGCSMQPETTEVLRSLKALS
ncbi:LysM peptidoglycan-binding domain-containing protein [Streptomyces sp. NRRL F-5630]|uniref:LysM peptidoglycan-binding domain-containing protein n=1 Tax=Streptomyces sp. NRRL F-5630 TaxID=1463864 RepID=UPI003D7146D4